MYPFQAAYNRTVLQRILLNQAENAYGVLTTEKIVTED
jgi:hypothetical protein